MSYKSKNDKKRFSPILMSLVWWDTKNFWNPYLLDHKPLANWQDRCKRHKVLSSWWMMVSLWRRLFTTKMCWQQFHQDIYQWQGGWCSICHAWFPLWVKVYLFQWRNQTLICLWYQPMQQTSKWENFFMIACKWSTLKSVIQMPPSYIQLLHDQYCIDINNIRRHYPVLLQTARLCTYCSWSKLNGGILILQ